MVDTVKHANEDGYAVVILNPSQTVWDYEAKTAMNFLSWKAKDKKTAALDPVKNIIPGNKTPEEHVEYVFNSVLRPMVREDAEIDVIAGGFAAYSIVKYLNSNCLYYRWQENMKMVLTPEQGTNGKVACSQWRFRNLRMRSIISPLKISVYFCNWYATPSSPLTNEETKC